MKKFAIVCAVVLAAGLVSCSDTNYCYKVTETYKVSGTKISHTYYWWGTKNDLKTYEQTLKDAVAKVPGIDEKSVSVSSKRTSKSQSDCYED